MTLAQIIAQLIGAAIGALLGAAILRPVTRRVAGFTPLYWQAYRATYVGYLSSFLVGFVLGIMIGIARQTIDASAIILMSIVAFFCQAGVYTRMLRGTDGTILPFGRACLISLVQLLVGAGIVLAVFTVIWAIASMAEYSSSSRPAQSSVLLSPEPSFDRSATQQRNTALRARQNDSAPLTIPSEMRVWTSKDGRTMSAIATKVSYRYRLVTFTRSDGRVYEDFSIDQLSENDQLLLLGRDLFEQEN